MFTVIFKLIQAPANIPDTTLIADKTIAIFASIAHIFGPLYLSEDLHIPTIINMYQGRRKTKIVFVDAPIKAVKTPKRIPNGIEIKTPTTQYDWGKDRSPSQNFWK